MGTSTSTGTLAAGESRTFYLAPASAVTLTLSPNVRVTITESPATVTATGLGGNATRVHEPRLPGVVTYGPYPMGGSVVVEVDSNSGSSVEWVYTSAAYATDSSGNVTGLVGPDGMHQLGRGVGRAVGVDPLAGTLSATIGTLTGQSGGTTVTATDVTTAQGPGVRYVTTGVTGEYAQLQWTLPESMTIRQIAALFYFDSAVISTIAFYAATSGGFGASTSISKTISVNASSGKNGAQSNGLPIYLIAGPSISNAWANTGSLDLNTTLFTQIRIRVTPVAGQLVDCTLVGLRMNPARKSRIAIVSDDGYKSWFKYALPLLQARGLRCSVAAIHELIGSSSAYMSESEFLELNANGHETLTHGPIDGGGSLIDNYATTAERIADMVASRANLKARGLFWSAAQEKCYIWPQGEFQDTASDTALLDAALAAGFTVGRTVSRFLPWSIDLAKSSTYGGLVLPIIGHSRQTSEVNEDAEIVNITDSIAYCAANGLDGVLMFHEIIADQGSFSATETTEIEVSRFITIIDAILTQIAAGKVENVLFSDFAL